MKVLKLLAALSLVALVSCNDNDDKPTDLPAQTNNENPNENPDGPDEIAGAWKLTNVSGGIMGISHNFAEGVINWTFDTNTQMVTVLNNNTDPQLQDIFASGTYPYDFVANEATPELCEINIVVGGVSLGCYDIGTSEFTMSQIEADGYMIKLVR